MTSLASSLLLAVWLAIGPACDRPDESPPAALPSAPESAPPAAEWSVDPAEYSALYSSYVWSNTAGATPPRGELPVEDPVAGRTRKVALVHTRTTIMPSDATHAHWLVDAEDTESHEPLVLDFEFGWRPSAKKVRDPSTPTSAADFEVTGVALQSVGGVDRWTWRQDGDVWIRTDALSP